MTPAVLLDYLFVGALLRERIEAVVAPQHTPLRVESIEAFAQATERNTATPTAFVLWEGDTFAAGEGGRSLGGAAQIVAQTWTVLLAVRNASQHQSDARNASAGPLLSALHRAIAGWRPEGSIKPFARTNGRKASYGANVGLYPLTFSIDLYL